LIGIVFGSFYLLPLLWAAGIGSLATVASGAYSIRVLLRLVPVDRLPWPIQRWLVALRLSDPKLADTSATHDMPDVAELGQ